MRFAASRTPRCWDADWRAMASSPQSSPRVCPSRSRSRSSTFRRVGSARALNTSSRDPVTSPSCRYLPACQEAPASRPRRRRVKAAQIVYRNGEVSVSTHTLLARPSEVRPARRGGAATGFDYGTGAARLGSIAALLPQGAAGGSNGDARVQLTLTEKPREHRVDRSYALAVDITLRPLAHSD